MTATVRKAYADYRHGQLHYRVAGSMGGERTPLMCFHLSPVSGVIYERLLGEIGMDRLAVAPDNPGFGGSDPPPSPPTIGDYAEVMGEFADSMGLGAVDVIGYHTGAKIGIELSLRRPELVRRLVLVSTPVYTDAELARQHATLGKPSWFDEGGAHLLEVWDGHWEWRGPGQTIEMVHETVAEVFRAGRRAWWGHRAAFEYQMGDRLPLVTHPTLVLCPHDDLLEPTRRSEPLIRNGRLLELPGWGHGMMDVHTEEFAGILRGFLDEDC